MVTMPALRSAYVRVAGGVALAICALGLVRLAVMVNEAAASPGAIGIDYVAVMDGARRWLAGGSPFLARQLGGPYPQLGANLADSGEFLYPPPALLLFAPFTFLPAILWWAVPIALTFGGLYRLRPARWSWPVLALFALVGASIPIMIQGNPTMWVVAAATWAPIIGWSGPLVLLKPSVAPLALFGITHRSWWIMAALMVLVSLPFGLLWVDWWTAIRDMRAFGPGGLAYSLPQLPILLIPVVAWAARTDVARTSPAEHLRRMRRPRLRSSPG